jgi:hypothetical protein
LGLQSTCLAGGRGEHLAEQVQEHHLIQGPGCAGAIRGVCDNYRQALSAGDGDIDAISVEDEGKYLKEACAQDEASFMEVASLFAQKGKSSEGLFESPALDAVAHALVRSFSLRTRRSIEKWQ